MYPLIYIQRIPSILVPDLWKYHSWKADETIHVMYDEWNLQYYHLPKPDRKRQNILAKPELFVDKVINFLLTSSSQQQQHISRDKADTTKHTPTAA